MSWRRSSSELWIVGAFVALCLYFSGRFPPFVNPNEISRYETVYSVVEEKTFAIDRAIPVLGDHEDKAASGDHLYSNKAPGLALAAIPVYRALRIFLPRPNGPNDVILLLLRILVVSSICALALYRFAVRIAASPAAPLILFAVAFGTPFLFYSRTFFSHAWTASLLFLSWDLLRSAQAQEQVPRVGALCFAAGLLAMWAVISEYPLAPIGLLLAARAFSGHSWKRLAMFAAGATPPLLLLGAYNAACFGSPFVVSSAREASPLYARLGEEAYFGFAPPSAAVAWRYLADPARGILIFSPFLIWVAPGFWKWWRSRIDRADMVFAWLSTAVYFVLMTGYRNWHGGWSLGDRYLLPALFFAGLALPHALESPVPRQLFLAAVVYSAAVHFFLTASWPHFPPELAWPVGNGAAWFLTRGWIAPSLLARFGVLALLVPVAATLGAGFVAARPLRRAAPKSGLAVVAGLLLAAGALLYRPEPSFGARLWRAAVFGAYSGLDPAREELRRAALSAQTLSERRQAAGAWRAYGPR